MSADSKGKESQTEGLDPACCRQLDKFGTLRQMLERDMQNPLPGYEHQELTQKIIGVFYEVYNELGHGFLETVYEEAMMIALADAGLRVGRQFPVFVHFRGRKIAEFKADLLVEGVVLVELKAARALASSHEAQTLNYLRGTNVEIGLLCNFGPKPEFKRLAFANSRKQLPPNPD